MARRRTPSEAWMGTLDEVDFCSPCISCEAYMLSMKGEREREKERERESIWRFAPVRGKNGDLRYFLPFNCCFFFLFLRAVCRTYLTS
jgi:hypothetical protein